MTVEDMEYEVKDCTARCAEQASPCLQNLWTCHRFGFAIATGVTMWGLKVI